MKGKRAMKLIAVFTALLAAFATVACRKDGHAHVWGDWTLSQPTTTEEAVIATRVCTENDGGEETETLPALDDSTFWTKTTATPAGHATDGVDKYTNATYGTVTMTTPKTGHTWGNEWTISPPATVDDPVIATRNCTANDGGTETETLPELSDSTFWTKSAGTPVHGVATDTYTNATYGTVTMTDGEVTHTWGEWTLSQPATVDEPVTAHRVCTENDGGEETETLPALSDSTFWTKSAGTPVHGVATDTYTNATYGTVTMAASAVTHNWGKWEIGQMPTMDAPGSATRKCKDYDTEAEGEKGEETLQLPAFSDSDFWTAGETVASPDYNTAAYIEYTNEEHEIALRYVTAPKLETAYDNKTYYSITLQLDPDESSYNGAKGVDTFSVSDSWKDASLELDANGDGEGSASPFDNNCKISFRMKDPNADEGEMEITYTEIDKDTDAVKGVKTYVAYLDKTSGWIVMFRQLEYGGWDFVFMIPGSMCSSQNRVSASMWGQASEYRLTVKVSPDSGDPVNAYLVCTALKKEAFIGVEFKDMQGQAVEPNAAYNAKCLYIMKGAEKIGAFGYDSADAKMKTLDGFDGIYTAKAEQTLTDDLVLDGLGGLTLGTLTGIYKVENEAEKQLLLLVNSGSDSKKSYLVVLDGGEYTAEEKSVHLQFEVNGAEMEPIEEKDVPYGFEYDLPTLEPTATKVFDRWTYDAAGSEELASPFVPTENKTLYAQWANRVDVTVELHLKDGVDSTRHLILAEGKSDLKAELRKIQEELTLVDYENLVCFLGWSLSEEGESLLDITGSELVSSSANGQTIHAVWKDIPIYYGTYYGVEIYTAGYTTRTPYESGKIVIDYDGTITGKFTAKVTQYDAESGLITATSETKTYYFFFDAESHSIAFRYENAQASELNSDTYVYSTNIDTGTSVKVFGIRCVPGGSSSGSQDEFATLSDFNLGGGKFVFTYYKTVAVVTVTDGFGTPITDLQQLNSCTSVVVSKGDEIIFSRGAAAGNTLSASEDTSELDEYRGSYTYSSGEELGAIALDGAGSIKLHTDSDAAAGTYTLEGNKACVYSGGAYYEIVLTKAAEGSTYAATKPMISVTLSTSDAASGYAGETLSKNKNIEFELDDPTAADYLFRGWFSDPDYEHELAKNADETKYVFTPTETCTLYAKWVRQVTITVHLEDGVTLPEGALGANGSIVTYGQGEEIAIVRPSKAGKKFAGWYTDADCLTPWGTKDENGVTTVTLGTDKTAIDLYPKWDDAPAYSGEYKLYYYDSTNANGRTDDGDTYTATITITPEGEIASTSGTAYPFSSSDFKVTEFADGKITFQKIGGNASTFAAHFDSVNKLIVFITRGTDDRKYGDMFLLVPVTLTDITVTGAEWGENGSSDDITRVIDVKKQDGSHIGVYLNSNEDPRFNVTFTSYSGAPIESLSEAHTANSLRIMQGDELIASFGYNGTTMVPTDGFEGVYTLSGADTFGLGSSLELNGVKIAKFGEKTGEYTVLEKSEGKIGVTLEDAYYEVTLTLEGKTYTIEKPMVNVNFSSEQGFLYDGGSTWSAQQSLNKNFEIEIPALDDTDGFVFRGWFATFAEGDFGNPLSLGENGYVYTPAEDGATLYAKWLRKVTITVHYGNGLPEETFVYGEGEAGYPRHPDYTNGQAWDGWYRDQACSEGQQWEDGTAVTEDIELYVKWLDATPVYGEWVGAEIFGSTDGGGTISGGTTEKTERVTAEGSASGEQSGTISEYNAETGTFKVGNYYGAIDLKNKVMIITCYSKVIDNDYYVFIDKTVTTSFKTSSSAACYWNGLTEKGSTKLAEMTLADGSTMTIFIYEGRVYGNVSFEATPVGATEVTAANAYQQAKTLTVKDSDGNVIAKFVRGAKGLEYSDGFEGTYTVEGPEGGSITLDGKGGIAATLGSDEKSGAYTFAESEAGYTFDVYLENDSEYYELTIPTPGTGVATMTKAMVTIMFEIKDSASGLTQEEMTYNKNIPVTLPATMNETEIITGWFTDEACTQPVELVDGKYKPTSGTTLYAKTAKKVTITVNYGAYSGTLSDEEIFIPSGAAPDLTAYIPEKQGIFVFGGWYLDAECTSSPYGGEAVSEDKTIYCKWIEQQYSVEFVGKSSSVQWVETEGVYRANVGGNDSVEVTIKITFTADGTFSFAWSASFTDSADGIFVALNAATPHQTSNKVFSSSGGNGTKEVTVKSGDILYIEAYTDYSYNSPSDFAEVSNFSFTANA